MPGTLAFDHPLEGSGITFYTTVNGESGEGVGEEHTLLVLMVRGQSLLPGQSGQVSLLSEARATMWPQSGPRWTPPGRVNTHPVVASGNGERSFLLFLEEILSFQVILGIRDLAMPLNPWS